jgi:hypothetical protein
MAKRLTKELKGSMRVTKMTESDIELMAIEQLEEWAIPMCMA